MANYLNLAMLEGANMVSSKERTRPYLGGVHVSFTKEGTVYVATDGHRLVRFFEKPRAGEEAATDMAFIMPADKIRAVCSLASYDFGKRHYLDFHPLIRADQGDGIVRLEMGDSIFGFPPVNGTFPDYHRVIPKMAAENKINGIGFNPQYLLSLRDALNHGLRRKDKGVNMYFGEDSATASIIKLRESDEAMGVIMPMRMQ